jgi:hypothetical protein
LEQHFEGLSDRDWERMSDMTYDQRSDKLGEVARDPEVQTSFWNATESALDDMRIVEDIVLELTKPPAQRAEIGSFLRDHGITDWDDNYVIWKRERRNY